MSSLARSLVLAIVLVGGVTACLPEKSPQAQFELGMAYEKGEDLPQDYGQAMVWYRKAAEQGHAEAEFALGMIYANGESVPQDYGQAMAWYRKAAEQGHAEAKFALGMIYANGESVPRDAVQAVAWISKAAEQGLVKAQLALGLMYSNGERVLVDESSVTQMMERSRLEYSVGFVDAKYNLGDQGVPVDYQQAYAWFSVAAAKGDAYADRYRDISAKKLSPTQIAEAQALATRYFEASQPK